MESFALLKNNLIAKTDMNSKNTSLSRPLKNTLKTLVKIPISQVFTTGGIYSKKFVVDIPRQYDNLSQLYIKCYLSTGSVASTVETSFASKIFKKIVLRTKKGTELQTITPEYSQARIDENFGTELYTHLNIGIEPDATFLSGDPTCVVPLFFYFSESENTFLNTRDLEQLELEAILNVSKESMGMSVDLSSASFELYALYHDENTSNKFSDQILTKKSVINSISGSFNIFNEDSLICSTGTTSARLLLRCPHPLYVLHLSLVNATSARAQITSVKLSVGNNTLIEFDYRMNYQNYGKSKSFVETGTVSLFFSKLKDRTVDSGLVTFSKEMFPCYLDVTFSSLDADYTLNAFEEYRTNYTVSKIGEVSMSDDVRDFIEGLDQLNSSTAAASLTG